MDISSVGGFAAAGKFPKANDNDGDDKGGVKASNNAGAQGVSAKESQKSETSRPAAPVAKSSEEDNVIQTKTQGSGNNGNGSVDVTA